MIVVIVGCLAIPPISTGAVRRLAAAAAKIERRQAPATTVNLLVFRETLDQVNRYPGLLDVNLAMNE